MWFQLLMAAAPIIARAIGEASAKGDFDKAEQLRQQAMAQLNIPLPDLKELQAQMPDTLLKGVQADSTYTSAQNEALSGMQKYATATGLQAQDQASLDQATMGAANAYSGMMGRNQQLRAARGQTGSGVDTADQLASAQHGADQAYHGALQVAGDAANRRQQAMGAYGSMAARFREADLAQKNLAAQSQDKINEFNTRQKSYGGQQYFGDETQLAKMKYGAYEDAGQQSMDAGNRKVQTAADIGSGIQKAGSAYDEGNRYDDFLKKKYGGGSGS